MLQTPFDLYSLPRRLFEHSTKSQYASELCRINILFIDSMRKSFSFITPPIHLQYLLVRRIHDVFGGVTFYSSISLLSRVLNDFYVPETNIVSSSTPTPLSPVSKLDRHNTGRLSEGDLLTGEGGGGGAKSFHGEKAWSSINNSILSGIQQLHSILRLLICIISFKFQCLSAFFLQKEFYLMQDLDFP